MALFSGWGSLTSRLQPLQRDGLIFKLAEMFIFTTILKGEMKYLHSYSSQHVSDRIWASLPTIAAENSFTTSRSTSNSIETGNPCILVKKIRSF